MANGSANKVILVGNLGRDPETRYMPSGGAVCNVALATSETWKDKNTGQPQERTEWHRIVFFNRLAEIVNEYVKKGSKLYIEGSLRTRSWEQDGIKRYATEIVATEMQMLDSRGGQSNDYSQAGSDANQNSQSGAAQNARPHNGQHNGSGGAGYGQQDQGAPSGGQPDYGHMPGGVDGGSFDDDIPFANPLKNKEFLY